MLFKTSIYSDCWLLYAGALVDIFFTLFVLKLEVLFSSELSLSDFCLLKGSVIKNLNPTKCKQLFICQSNILICILHILYILYSYFKCN